jgi:hypothetical protein
MQRQLLLLITIFALDLTGTAQIGAPPNVSAKQPQSSDPTKASSKRAHPNFIEYSPCEDQPRTYKELVSEFKKGRLPLATGVWKLGRDWRYKRGS